MSAASRSFLLLVRQGSQVFWPPFVRPRPSLLTRDLDDAYPVGKMPHDVVFWLTDCAPTGRVGVCVTWTVLEEPHAATLDGATQYADVMECAFDIVYGFSSLFEERA